MYTIYLCAAIGIVIGLRSNGRGFGQRTFGFVLGGFLGAFIGLVASFILTLAIPTHEVAHGPVKLVSMRSADGMSGTFILGSGNLGRESNYHFMMKLDDGSLTPGSVPADSQIRIIEDDTLESVGYWTTIMKESNRDSFLYAWSTGHYRRIVRQEFHVPAGTVVQTFEVR